MRCGAVLFVALSLSGLVLAVASAQEAKPKVQLSPATTHEEVDLVDISSVSPGIGLEIRYFGTDNFIGDPVRGYEAPKCFLLSPVAEALAKVQVDLKSRGYQLKIFDCYRPARSVAHFVEWAHDLSDQRQKAKFYPVLDKTKLLDGYIAEVSGHSRGATVDLTMQRCRWGRCSDLDMGTGFDYFGPLANTANPDITRKQAKNRQLLKAAMEKQGFRNYSMEWWHYTLSPEPEPLLMYDVPVR